MIVWTGSPLPITKHQGMFWTYKNMKYFVCFVADILNRNQHIWCIIGIFPFDLPSPYDKIWYTFSKI